MTNERERERERVECESNSHNFVIVHNRQLRLKETDGEGKRDRVKGMRVNGIRGPSTKVTHNITDGHARKQNEIYIHTEKEKPH